MAVNDILPIYSATFGPNGAVRYVVGQNATAINPGEPVVRAAGGTSVTVMATNKPVASSDYLAGIATTTSTNSSSADGYVYVQPILPGSIWKIKPTVAASWNTQSEYDALVGKRVLSDLTAGIYTLLASDSANNGCVVMWKDVSIDPGFIYFSFRRTVVDMTA
jgi:hypothetical protein